VGYGATCIPRSRVRRRQSQSLEQNISDDDRWARDRRPLLSCRNFKLALHDTRNSVETRAISCGFPIGYLRIVLYCVPMAGACDADTWVMPARACLGHPTQQGEISRTEWLNGHASSDATPSERLGAVSVSTVARESLRAPRPGSMTRDAPDTKTKRPSCHPLVVPAAF